MANCQEESTPMRITDRSRASLFNGRATPECNRYAPRQALTGRHARIFSLRPPKTPARHAPRRLVRARLCHRSDDRSTWLSRKLCDALYYLHIC